MEHLLQYIWQNRLFYPAGIITNDDASLPVEVLNPGVLSKDAVADFSCAIIKIGDTQWAGNVEIHVDGNDWYTHHHDKDRAYNNVILHVVQKASAIPAKDSNGRVIPEIILRFPDSILERFDTFSLSHSVIRCADSLACMPQLVRDAWLDRLLIERMQQRVELVESILTECGGDWEQALFCMIARSLGQGVNSEQLQTLARRTPLRIVKRLSSQMEIEALLYGVAGLLDELKSEDSDEYVKVLKREFSVLKARYRELQGELQPIIWKRLRIRPGNFPAVRIAQLASVVFASKGNLSSLYATIDIKSIDKSLNLQASPYWESHYDLGRSGSEKSSRIGHSSRRLILLNGIIPWMYTRARLGSEREKQDNILKMLEFVKPETNSKLDSWIEIGINPENEAEAQALLMLYNGYCQHNKCLHCHWCHYILKKKINI